MIVVKGIFDHAAIRRMSAGFDRLRLKATRLALQGRSGMVESEGAQFVIDRDPASGVRIRRVVWCGAADDVLDRFGEDPRLMEIVGQLLGSSEMDHLIHQAHFKLPDDRVAFPWHQDSAHRRYGTPEWTDVNGRGSFVQALAAIDEMHADNGPVLWIPGSSARGHLTPAPGTRELPIGSVNPSDARPLLLCAGDVAFFGPYTIHGSRPNTSASARRVFVNGFASPGANRRVYPGAEAGAGRRVSVRST
jgi:hypothetical protein